MNAQEQARWACSSSCTAARNTTLVPGFLLESPPRQLRLSGTAGSNKRTWHWRAMRAASAALSLGGDCQIFRAANSLDDAFAEHW